MRIGARPPTSDLDADEEQLRNVFDFFDQDGSGLISRGELRNGLRHLGRNPDEEAINLLLAKIDANGDGVLDNNELIKFMREQAGDELDHAEEDLGVVFQVLDPSGSGSVLGERIRDMLMKYGAPADPEVVLAFQSDKHYSFKELMAVIMQDD